MIFLPDFFSLLSFLPKTSLSSSHLLSLLSLARSVQPEHHPNQSRDSAHSHAAKEIPSDLYSHSTTQTRAETHPVGHAAKERTTPACRQALPCLIPTGLEVTHPCRSRPGVVVGFALPRSAWGGGFALGLLIRWVWVFAVVGWVFAVVGWVFAMVGLGLCGGGLGLCGGGFRSLRWWVGSLRWWVWVFAEAWGG